MKEISVSVQGVEMDFRQANAVAKSIAALFEKEPTVVAWHDADRNLMSPVIEGADIHSRWHDYGASMGGDIDVSVNGGFDFIFADTSTFEGLGQSPYVALHDDQGHEYLCLAEHLRDPKNPHEEACFRIDDVADAPSGVHEG